MRLKPATRSRVCGTYFHDPRRSISNASRKKRRKYNMSDVLTRDLVVYDPLTETTRKERRVLLGVSALGIALVKVPLVPTKFTALGLEFTSTNQAVLLTLYSLLVAYFLVGFLIYAFSDYVAWNRTQVIHHLEYIRQDAMTRKNLGPVATKESWKKFTKDGCPYDGLASFRSAKFAAGLRAIFEFLVPIGIAGYAIASMLLYKS